MAFEITKLGVQPKNEAPETEGWGSYALRNLVRGTGQIAKQGIQLAELVGSDPRQIGMRAAKQLTGQSNEPILPLSAALGEKTAELFPEKYLEPQGSFESWMDKVWSDVPLIAATGGSAILPGLVRSSVSNAAIQKAQDAGYGPFSQMLAGLVGGSVTDFARRTGSLKSLKLKADDLRKTEYSKASKVAQNLAKPAPEVRKSISNILAEVADELPSKGQKQADKILRTIEEDIFLNNDLNVKKAWDRKRQLNQMARTTKDPVLRTYLQRTSTVLTDFLNQVGEKHPEFGKPYQLGEDLTRGLKVKSSVGKFFNKKAAIKQVADNPVAQAAILMGTGLWDVVSGKPVKGAKKLALSFGVPYALAKGFEARDFINNSKEVRGWLKQAMIDATYGDTAGMATLFKNVNRAANEYEKQKPASKGKFEITKLG